jgi:hypothetical protein
VTSQIFLAEISLAISLGQNAVDFIEVGFTLFVNTLQDIGPLL